MILHHCVRRPANGGDGHCISKISVSVPPAGRGQSVRLGNPVYAPHPRQLGWHFESQGFVRRESIRRWSPALSLSLRRGRGDFSNSIPLQDTRWLELDDSWSYKQFERRNRSSRWHY